jgi:hypothetical protein
MQLKLVNRPVADRTGVLHRPTEGSPLGVWLTRIGEPTSMPDALLQIAASAITLRRA